MKLYYSKGACSLAIRIALHEMNIPCTFESVDLATKKTETGLDFLTINSKGSVPVLQLDSGERLTEGAVIQQYLADTHSAYHLLPRWGGFERYRVLEWLNFVASDVHKGFSPLFNSKVPEDVKENVFKPNLKRLLNFVAKHLEKNMYLNGDALSIADFYLFAVLGWLPYFNISLSEWLPLERYVGGLCKRKAVQQALEEEGLLMSDSNGSACSVK